MKKVVFFLIFAIPAFAGSINYEFTPSSLVFTLTFNGSYSNLGYSKTANEYILDFETLEAMSLSQPTAQAVPSNSVDFWNLPILSARLATEGIKNKLTLTFAEGIIEPNITAQDKTLRLDFPLPAAAATTAPPAPTVGLGAYFQMFLGLLLVVIFILLCFAVMKMFFKTNITSDIPGSGRLLGKIDLAMKKTVFFYELGESIYILGGTDNSINLIDKLTDPVEINLIKSGFAKRKNFSSYLKFFHKEPLLKDEIADSGAILEDKLSKLQKK
jgi:flagellar biogenesis protein FliO